MGTADSKASSPYLSRQKWDTRNVRRDEQFAYYREGLCQSFLSLSPERPPNGSISAVIETITSDEAVLSRLDFSPHTIRRTKTDVNKMGEEFFQLSLYVGGELRRDPDTNPTVRKAGGLFLDKANDVSNYCIAGDKHMACIGLSLKNSLLYKNLEKNVTESTINIERSIYTENMFNSLLLLNKRFAAGSIEELSALGSAAGYLLIAHIFKGPDEQRLAIAEQSGPEGIIIIAKEHIDRELTNPMLSAAFLASRLGVSVRYVHKLFERENLTFGHYVRTKRLERIRADLMDPAYRNVAIADIAARWGLADPTTFHRNFKSHYGDTPKQIRLLSRA